MPRTTKERDALVLIRRYGLLAYNGTETIAEACTHYEESLTRAAQLRSEGWSVCEMMGIFGEIHTADGQRLLSVERGTR